MGYKDTTIYVMAIDTSGSGFNLSKEAMQKLTNGEGIEAGKVTVTYSPADASYCSNTNWYEFTPLFRLLIAKLTLSYATGPTKDIHVTN